VGLPGYAGLSLGLGLGGCQTYAGKALALKGDEMSDEQSSEGQQPDPWAAWSADAGQPGEPGQPGDEPGHGASAPPGGQPGSFAQPGYGEGGYGQPGHAQPGYDQTGHAQPGYGEGGYGQPGYGQPGYGEGGYGQPGYGQPSYGQPGSPPPPPPPGFGSASSHTQPIGFAQQNQYGQPGYDPYHPYGQPPSYGYPGPTRRRRRASNLIAYIAVAIVAAVVGGLFVDLATGSNSTPPSANSGNGGNTNPFNSLPFNNGNNSNSGNSSGVSSGTVKKVQDAIMPGLVVISSNLQYQDDAAEATGMIISSNGLVLTNNHVINGTTGLTARVVNANGQGTGPRYTARWLGYDKTADVAVIQLVGASGLHTVPLGNSNAVKVGDGVVAMGNANGTGYITTVKGKITGLDEKITASDNGASSETLTDMIQTNSQIIPGDSGGPLASVDGQVIGMDTAASTNTYGLGSQQDVGFAIPINRAVSIADQIISGKSSSVVRVGSVGFLGVVVVGGTSNKIGAQSTLTNPQQQATQEQQELQQAGSGGFGGSPGTGCMSSDAGLNSVPNNIAPVNSGTLVLGALCGTPAAAAGMVPGDVITSVDGRSVSSPASLVTILSVLKSGQTVPVGWVTPGGSTMDRSMTLAAAPPE
jgi:S1-C subfamily serine protease